MEKTNFIPPVEATVPGTVKYHVNMSLEYFESKYPGWLDKSMHERQTLMKVEQERVEGFLNGSSDADSSWKFVQSDGEFAPGSIATIVSVNPYGGKLPSHEKVICPNPIPLPYSVPFGPDGTASITINQENK